MVNIVSKEMLEELLKLQKEYIDNATNTVEWQELGSPSTRSIELESKPE